MGLVTIVQIVFAAAAVLAVLSLLAAIFDRAGHTALVSVAVLLGLTAAAAWVSFGLRPKSELAVAAGGITVAFATAIVAVKLRTLLRSARRMDHAMPPRV